MQLICRRDILKALAVGGAHQAFSLVSPLRAADQPEQSLPADFVKLIHSYVPQDALFVHVGENPGTLLQLKDGSLLGLSNEGRAVSQDGGRTWNKREPVHDVDGHSIADRAGFHTALRLNSGAIGAFCSQSQLKSKYGLTEWFRRSEDKGRTWSRAVQVGDPYHSASMRDGGAVVTRSGRVVATLMDLLGEATSQSGKARARFRDRTALIGHHGYSAHFTYLWTENSDDEGRSWKSNAGRGVWAAGGELFVSLDESAGGFYGCDEPTIAELNPGRLLMLQRTALGRLYQSWSTDNGTTWTRPEPTMLAASQAPASLGKIPGTGDLLVLWNQSSPEEIERGLQRHRISSAISKDGGITWIHGRNIYSIFMQQGDITRLDPPPIRAYRAMREAPALPSNDVEGTYPVLSFWKDTVIIRFGLTERAANIYDAEGKLRFDRPYQSPEERARLTGLSRPAVPSASVCMALPVSWFYQT